MTSRGLYTCLPITFDWIEIETWDRCQSVCLGETHRLICNMTYLGHLRSLCDLDLRLNFEVDLSRSTYRCFDSSRRDKHDGTHIISVSLKLQK